MGADQGATHPEDAMTRTLPLLALLAACGEPDKDDTAAPSDSGATEDSVPSIEDSGSPGDTGPARSGALPPGEAYGDGHAAPDDNDAAV